MCISAASNILDDRLSLEANSKIPTKLAGYLEQIEYDKLEPEVRQSCLISVNLIKHTAALLTNDFAKAEDYRNSLKMVSSENDIIIRRLSLRSSIAQMNLSQKDEIMVQIENYTSIEKSTLQTFFEIISRREIIHA